MRILMAGWHCQYNGQSNLSDGNHEAAIKKCAICGKQTPASLRSGHYAHMPADRMALYNAMERITLQTASRSKSTGWLWWQTEHSENQSTLTKHFSVPLPECVLIQNCGFTPFSSITTFHSPCNPCIISRVAEALRLALFILSIL